MRLGVLDVGSNSAHLCVVDAHPGSPPLPVYRHRAPTRLADATGTDGVVSEAGVRCLVAAVRAVLLLDIGGGSVEIVYGRDEDPAVVVSLPLGVGRLTRSRLPDHPASADQVRAARREARDTLRPLAQQLRWAADATRLVATSKRFKQLARLAGRTSGDAAGSGACCGGATCAGPPHGWRR